MKSTTFVWKNPNNRIAIVSIIIYSLSTMFKFNETISILEEEDEEKKKQETFSHYELYHLFISASIINWFHRLT